MPSLNLVVIRTADLDRACCFYEVLGLKLQREQHGKGPLHFSADVDGITFEIYPQGSDPSTAGLRLGFQVPSVDETIIGVKQIGGSVRSEPANTAWGYRAVVVDFDGHRIEITQPDRRSI